MMDTQSVIQRNSQNWDDSLVNKNSHDILENPQSADMGFNMYASTNRIVNAIVVSGSLGDMSNAVSTFRRAASCSALGVLVFRINEQCKADNAQLRLDYHRRALKSPVMFELGTITEVFDIMLLDRAGNLIDQCMIPAKIIKPDCLG